MENYKKKAIDLISNLALEYKANPSVIPYYPAKTKISAYERKSLPRKKAERVGLDSALLCEMLMRLEGEERANIHSLMVAKGDAVILECSRPYYDTNTFHLSHSMSKTVIGMVIGALYDDGYIDLSASLTSYFPNYPISDERMNGVTVEHLLTMQSGISFSELGSVTDSEWTRAALASAISFTPGEAFAYNSMNSYLLARIASITVREKYGTSLSDYIYKRLFSPLGITNFLWEKGPEGCEKGGWGLYLSCESWLKLGIMMKNLGEFQGARILSEEWVKRSIAPHAKTPENLGDFNYGYQLWVSRDGCDFLFNGMLGQNVFISPENDVTVALSSGNNELFQESPALNIIREFLAPKKALATPERKRGGAKLAECERKFFEGRRWITPRERMKGLSYFFGFRSATPFLAPFEELIGRYDFAKNNQGLLPIFVRAMQNNYQGGIESFTFLKKDDRLRLISCEGGVSYSIDFGFYKPETSVITYSGEKYLISALADAEEDESGNIEYRLELIFPELPNTRRITLIPKKDGELTVCLSEIPDKKITDAFTSALPAMNPRISFLLGLVEHKLGKNFIDSKLTELFSPELFSIKTDSPRYAEALGEANDAIERKIAASRLIRGIISHFTGAEKPKKEDEQKTPAPKSGIISSIFGKIFKKD